MKLLLVEDQSMPRKTLGWAIAKVCPKYFPDTSVEVARCYEEAREMLGREQYGIVLLDHRMPRIDVGNLEETDFTRFCDSLDSIGYSLIPSIREQCPGAVIIGTSSSSPEELRGMPTPDYTIGKTFGEAKVGLERIIGERTSR